MNKDELEGKVDKIKDRAKEVVESLGRRSAERPESVDGEDIDIDPEIEESDDE